LAVAVSFGIVIIGSSLTARPLAVLTMRYLIITIVISAFTCFAQEINCEFQIELERSYQKDSIKINNELIKLWEQKSTPISKEKISDIHKIIYNIYEDFYKSDLFIKELNQMLKAKLNNIILVQNEIVFDIIDSIPSIKNDYDFNVFLDSTNTLVQDTIYNFSPTIDFASSSILYFNNNYKKILIDFLFEDKDLFDEKWQFIFYNLPIQMESSLNPIPYFLTISVNQDFNNALIYFYFTGEGKVALLENTIKGWVVKDTKTVFTM
jgi:hypothetical protein